MFVEAKKFSNISFDSISKGRRSDLLFHHDAQPMKRIFIPFHEEDKISGGDPLP